jgi:hypothetical protein
MDRKITKTTKTTKNDLYSSFLVNFVILVNFVRRPWAVPARLR